MINPIINRFMKFANELKFTKLFILICFLFIINLFIPDFIPFLDEILLGLFAVILAKIKNQKKLEDKGTIIEGEVIDTDSEKR